VVVGHDRGQVGFESWMERDHVVRRNFQMDATVKTAPDCVVQVKVARRCHDRLARPSA
jgi:hypothetical protein